MSSQDTTTKMLGPLAAAGCLGALVLLVVFDAPTYWQAAPVVLGITFGLGCACGQVNAKTVRKTSMPGPQRPTESAVPETAPQKTQSEAATGAIDPPTEMLRNMLNELTQMQKEDDLAERYQCFIRVIESALRHALGQCNVSLWVSDEEHENLIECLIRPSRSIDTAGGLHASVRKRRDPYILPIDSSNIRRSLETGQPFLIDASSAEGVIAGHSPDLQLRHSGCIPLYRPYGEPLLIVFEHMRGGVGKDRKKAFLAAVELIEMFWNHLQATNQRQWMVEHDPDTQAVRADVFLNAAQEMADCLQRNDELFTLVVVTVQGFRKMFAGTSQKWNHLYGSISRGINRILTQRDDQFLLGTMADDVLALLLPGKDAFLSRALMSGIVKTLAEQLQSEACERLSGIMAISIKWRLVDHRQYRGNVQALLDETYSRLFGPEENDGNHTCHIELDAVEAETP